MTLEIKIAKLYKDAIIPEYFNEASGADIYSREDYLIRPGSIQLVSTGLKVEVPKGYEMQIRPKSGLALNYGLTVLNTPGTIDSDYRGEVGVILINHSDKEYNIKKGQKVAQAVIQKVERAQFKVVKEHELSITERDKGGFGSTGLTNSK